MAMTTAFQAVYPGSNPGRRIFYIFLIIKHTKMGKNNKKTKGYVMASVGFLMIVFNAISYFTSDSTQPALLILGLVFVVIGMGWTKK